MAESPSADRILVIRLGALGDVVRTHPAVASLRAHYPGAQITWLVEPAAAGVLQGQPVVDEVLVFPRDRLQGHLAGLRVASLVRDTLRFVRVLRACRFDLVVDFHGILKSGVLAWLSGASLRVGYAPPVSREQAWRFANRLAVLSPEKMSRFDRNDALVRFLGAAPREPDEMSGALRRAGSNRSARGCLQLDSASAARVEALRREPVAVIHPGTSSATPYKRYTAEGYGEAASGLQASAGIGSLVAYGPTPGELEFAQQIVKASQGAARLAPETTSFVDLAVLLAGARLFIGSDSGPLHAASLLGTPVVQLLGPTDPVENAPFAGTPSRSVRVPVACSPCRRGCAAATCMRVIPSERIVVAALELLECDARSAAASASAEAASARPTATPRSNPPSDPAPGAAARAAPR